MGEETSNQDENLLGIENIKDLVDFAIPFARTMTEALEDGKISIWEVVGIMKFRKKFSNLIKSKSFSSAVKEVRELDSEERAQLLLHISQEHKIDPTSVEAVIDDSMAVVESAVKLQQTFDALNNRVDSNALAE